MHSNQSSLLRKYLCQIAKLPHSLTYYVAFPKASKEVLRIRAPLVAQNKERNFISGYSQKRFLALNSTAP